MKTHIICSLFLSSLLALGDAPAPPATTSPAPASSLTPEKARALEIRDSLISLGRNGNPDQASWDAIRSKIDNYQTEFGISVATTNNVILLRKMELSVAKKFADPTRYTALLTQLSSDPLPAVAGLAGQQLAVQKRLEALKTQPLDLQFTALDGTSVDLAKLRGKVVLIDFWATWCPPCVGETPDVVAAYKKYHDQGFEIVGISLDRDKTALLAYTKQNAMAWPQYFDGKMWNNDISKSFGISSIPAMWLLDKKGIVVTTNGRDDLDGQVDNLLKAP